MRVYVCVCGIGVCVCGIGVCVCVCVCVCVLLHTMWSNSSTYTNYTAVSGTRPNHSLENDELANHSTHRPH